MTIWGLKLSNCQIAKSNFYQKKTLHYLHYGGQGAKCKSEGTNHLQPKAAGKLPLMVISSLGEGWIMG